jgi:hypothetical protein
MAQRSVAVDATWKEDNGRRQEISWTEEIQDAMAERGFEEQWKGREKL